MLVDLGSEEASEPIQVSSGRLPSTERVGRLVQETLRIGREMRREALEIGLVVMAALAKAFEQNEAARP